MLNVCQEETASSQPAYVSGHHRKRYSNYSEPSLLLAYTNNGNRERRRPNIQTCCQTRYLCFDVKLILTPFSHTCYMYGLLQQPRTLFTTRVDPAPLKNHKFAIGSLRNTGTDPPREAIRPLGPIASRGGSVRPSVKCVDGRSYQDSTDYFDPPMTTIMSGSPHFYIFCS